MALIFGNQELQHQLRTSNAVEPWVLSLGRMLGEGEARARARNLLHDLMTHFFNRRKEGIHY